MPSYVFNATKQQCHEAWINPDHLNQWLAESSERVDSDLIVASKLPDMSGRHKITKETEDELEFDWYIEGARTRLNLKFVQTGSKTTVHLNHNCGAAKPMGALFFEDRDNLSQAWTIAFCSLREFVETGVGKSVDIPWPLNTETVILKLKLNGVDPEKVWRALTTPEDSILGNSLTTEVIIEPKVGGRFSYGWGSEKEDGDGPGHVLVWDENKHLAHTWFGGSNSEIHYEINSSEGKEIELLFKHTGMIYHLGDVWSYALGWSETLYGIKWFLERGEKHSSFASS